MTAKVTRNLPAAPEKSSAAKSSKTDTKPKMKIWIQKEADEVAATAYFQK